MRLRKGVQLYNSFNHFIDLREIDDDSIIVDAGACWGEFIRCLRDHEQGRNCRIIAIECCKDNIKVLKKENYQNVTICDKALVGQNFPDGVVFSQVIDNKGWGNLFKRVYKSRKGVKRTKEYEVETLRINDVFAVLGVKWIDFLKMDIEGSEGDVLETMTMETASRIGQMSMEVHEWCGFTISDVMERLDDLGFKAVNPDERNREVFGKRLYIDK